jgi:histidinol dehydrogenase
MKKIISTQDKEFKEYFEELKNRGAMDIEDASIVVTNILKEIKKNPKKALLQQISDFDNWTPSSMEDIKISKESMREAYDNLNKEVKESLHLSYDRIYSFHEKQKQKSWFDYEKNGVMTGVKVTPMQKAGLYIPGGKAAYPSSLLMNAIPAIVAGVEDIIVCTPAPNNEVNSLLLAACHICNLEKVFKVGGASAIGAMAYGVEDILKVDVITGPGNIYVATAKKLVYGEVNIDMIAGPSEIGIIADESARGDYIAMDMLSQAEHDEMASSILICTSEKLAKDVQSKINIFINDLDRKKIAKQSIDNRAAFIVAKDIDEAISLMDEIAPEHLEVLTKDPFSNLPYIKNAGAIFLGENTPEPIGDYLAGPNHTLPTGGSAKFYSPLSTEHFMKKSSIIYFSKKGILEVGKQCEIIASLEGLDAHKKSVELRRKNLK